MGIPILDTPAAPAQLSLALKAKLFRGLADPSRLSILEALADGERTVSDLMTVTGLSQSNTSGHLACLRECGLVVPRQEGRYVHYALAHPRVRTLLGEAAGILADVAERLYACTRYAEVPR